MVLIQNNQSAIHITYTFAISMTHNLQNKEEPKSVCCGKVKIFCNGCMENNFIHYENVCSNCHRPFVELSINKEPKSACCGAEMFEAVVTPYNGEKGCTKCGKFCIPVSEKEYKPKCPITGTDKSCGNQMCCYQGAGKKSPKVSQPSPDWEREFDSRYAWLENDTSYKDSRKDIKSFITHAVEAARKEGYTKGVNDTYDVLEPLGIAKGNFNAGRELERERVVKMIEEMMLKSGDNLGHYNALNGLLANLKER